MTVEAITFPVHDEQCGCYDCRYFGGQPARIVETIIVVEVEKKTFAGEPASVELVALNPALCGLRVDRAA